jgi:hypothetical protein
VKTETTQVTQPVATTDTVVTPSGYMTTTTTHHEPVSSATTVRIVPR